MSEIPALKPVDPVSAADLVLQAVMTRDAKRELARSELASDDLWCLGCNRFPRHVGIIFLVDPAGTSCIDGTMWTGVREENAKYFWGSAEQVVCRQCLELTGERVPLRVSQVTAPHPSMGFCFTVPRHWRERFVHKLSRKALAEFLPKPQTPEEPKPAKAPTDAGSRKPAPLPAA